MRTFVLFSLILGLKLPVNANPIGDVSELNGNAQIVRDEPFIAELKLPIQQNDTAITKNGRMGITFLDSSQVWLTEYSKLFISKYVYSPDPNKSELGLKFSLGTARFLSSKLNNINKANISLFLGPNFHYVVYPINNDKKLNFIGILKHKLNSNEQENYNLFNESSFIKNIKFKLSQKVSQSFLESLQNIKLFPIFVSKNLYNPPKNIFLVGDAFFAFSPSFAQGASQSIEGANELYECLINNNNFYDIRLKRVKMINNRSNFNQFAFHLSNPIMIIFRNIFLKLLTKNKKFLESYLGKIYKS